MVKLMLKNRTTERASSYEEVYRAATSLGKQNLTRVLAAAAMASPYCSCEHEHAIRPRTIFCCPKPWGGQ